jgi:hypothetical protein
MSFKTIFLNRRSCCEYNTQCEFLGTQIGSTVAINCYTCSRAGCNDPFNPTAVGVTQVASTTGWCTVCSIVQRLTKRHFLFIES